MGVYGDLTKLNQLKKTKTAAIAPTPPPIPARARDKDKEMVKPRASDTKQPRHHDTMTPRHRDTTIGVIRAAVKVFGKEAATHRFTPEEKRAIRDIVYAYQGQGIRTNENEISRIGVNFLIEDYRINGENSVLHQVLKALNG